MYKSALPGQRFGRLVVTEIISGRLRRCLCDCGTETTVARCNLTSGNTQSCGCLRREIEKIAAVTHNATSGQTWTPAYTTWNGMLQRCCNPNNPRWSSYGGRGIAVCEEWQHSFEAFLEDMGERPAGHSLHRIDNDGPYCKENCAWATDTQQARYRGNNRLLSYQNETKTLAQWSEDLHIPYFTLHARLRRGWSAEQALSVEVKHV